MSVKLAECFEWLEWLILLSCALSAHIHYIDRLMLIFSRVIGKPGVW